MNGHTWVYQITKALKIFFVQLFSILENLLMQRILLTSNLFASSSLYVFCSSPLKYRMLIFFSCLARLETEKWSDFLRAAGRSYVSAGMISVKDTYPSFSLSLVIFVTIAYATNTITVDTSVLLLLGHQEIKLAVIYPFDPFLKFYEVKTKCHNFIIQKETKGGLWIFLKLYFYANFH